MTTVPVLLLVYKRPQHVARVIEALRAVQCPTLYVAADGPRHDIAGEAARCAAARAAALQVDWPCRVETRFLETNHGCARAVSSAITWFFEHHDRGIILEEDCIPHPSFFRFCDELLEVYADDDRIGVITGNNFQRGHVRGSASYYFSRYPHCWGWATWRRAWARFDFDACAAYQDDPSPHRSLPALGFSEAAYWAAMRRLTVAGFADSWANRWMHSLWRHDMLTITPQRNLVVNIGFGPDATHTKTTPSQPPDPQAVEFPLQHPQTVGSDEQADRLIAQTYFKVPKWPLVWLSLAKKTLGRALGGTTGRNLCMTLACTRMSPGLKKLNKTAKIHSSACGIADGR